MLADPERSDLRFQRRGPGMPSLGRGTGRSGYASAALGERRLDHLPLARSQLVGERPHRPGAVWRASQRGSTVSVPESQMMTARSITFCSSRTLPGQR